MGCNFLWDRTVFEKKILRKNFVLWAILYEEEMKGRGWYEQEEENCYDVYGCGSTP